MGGGGARPMKTAVMSMRGVRCAGAAVLGIPSGDSDRCGEDAGAACIPVVAPYQRGAGGLCVPALPCGRFCCRGCGMVLWRLLFAHVAWRRTPAGVGSLGDRRNDDKVRYGSQGCVCLLGPPPSLGRGFRVGTGTHFFLFRWAMTDDEQGGTERGTGPGIGLLDAGA